MRTAIALVLLLGVAGAIGTGIALSDPPKEQPTRRIAAQPVAAQRDNMAVEASAISGVPAQSPISPRGWLVSGPNGGAFVARVVTPGPAGWQDIEPGGMLGSTAVDTTFSSPSLNPGNTFLKVHVNGFSEVHGPGYSGFGTGPTAPGGNFSLSGGITVTAVP